MSSAGVSVRSAVRAVVLGPRTSVMRPVMARSGAVRRMRVMRRMRVARWMRVVMVVMVVIGRFRQVAIQQVENNYEQNDCSEGLHHFFLSFLICFLYKTGRCIRRR